PSLIRCRTCFSASRASTVMTVVYASAGFRRRLRRSRTSRTARGRRAFQSTCITSVSSGPRAPVTSRLVSFAMALPSPVVTDATLTLRECSRYVLLCKHSRTVDVEVRDGGVFDVRLRWGDVRLWDAGDAGSLGAPRVGRPAGVPDLERRQPSGRGDAGEPLRPWRHRRGRVPVPPRHPSRRAAVLRLGRAAMSTWGRVWAAGYDQFSAREDRKGAA